MRQQLREARLGHMADGHRQSIGSIIGLRDGVEPELNLDHLLNLPLTPMAVAGDILLHLKRCIFVNWKPLISCGKDSYTTSLPNSQCCSKISGDKELHSSL